MSATGSTPRDLALASVPHDLKATLLAQAGDLGIHSPRDGAWVLLAMILDARRQVDTVGGHVLAFKQSIHFSTTHLREAGLAIAEAGQQVSTDLVTAAAGASGEVVTAIQNAQKGAVRTANTAAEEAVNKATGALTKKIASVGDDTVTKLNTASRQLGIDFTNTIDKYRVAIIKSFADQAAAAAKDSVSSKKLNNFWLVALILIGCVAGGAGGMYGWLDQSNRITSTPLIVNTYGHTECAVQALKNGPPVRMCEVQSVPKVAKS
jgi:hypothetical protein